MSKGKFERLNACANEEGIIAALAVDHRGNLLEAIAEARGPGGRADAADMLTFKSIVTRMLTPYASAILLDPEYGLGAIESRASGRGVLLAYEQSGYDVRLQTRLPDLLPEWSVRRLREAGADAIKVLLFYNPRDSESIKRLKQVYVERIGAECRALGMPFFLEPLVYDARIGDEKGLAFALRKPEYVGLTVEEFSRRRYGVDILKIELPVDPAFVEGSRDNIGREVAYTRAEALEHMRVTASKTHKPFIYLSGGASDESFCEMLDLAAEAGVPYSGVLCGRATWLEGIAIYASQGPKALESWLAVRGARNIRAINEAVARGAVPWWTRYGGRERIEIMESQRSVR